MRNEGDGERSWKDKLNSLSCSYYPNTSRWRWGGKNIFSFCLFQINFCTFRARLLALTDLITHSHRPVSRQGSIYPQSHHHGRERDEWNGCIRVCVYLILVETRRRRKAESKQASTKKLKEEFDMSCEIKQTFSSVWIQQWYMYHFVVIWYKQLTSRGGIYLKRLSLTNFFSSSALSSSPFYPCK